MDGLGRNKWGLQPHSAMSLKMTPVLCPGAEFLLTIEQRGVK